MKILKHESETVEASKEGNHSFPVLRSSERIFQTMAEVTMYLSVRLGKKDEKIITRVREKLEALTCNDHLYFLYVLKTWPPVTGGRS